jgi:hypothetical protein
VSRIFFPCGPAARLRRVWRDSRRATRGEALAVAGNLARAVLRNGRDAVGELAEAVTQKWERTRPAPDYAISDGWAERMHAMVGASWPCADVPAFEAVYAGVLEELRALGVTVGTDAFVGWSDGDPALAQAVWCLTRHLRPVTVVETGVARGITSRIILEAMERNGHGRLWSIDLPPQLRPQLNHEVAAAVPASRRGRWVLVHGSSRQRLVPLLRRLGSIGMFVHDSRHTSRNLCFELSRAWPRLVPGGVTVADDIDLNHGLSRFLAGTTGYRVLVAPARLPDPTRRPGRALFAVVGKVLNQVS